ncbi:carboxypeptidase regulatory-like domain-containing protein [Arsenicibacter rosenii]|uniref:carboxypeptidase regulatory-like domain-containing protein n=1 Tax=Arsenicibacter rosenii TaxID=1750698 RepID=UPI0011606EFF|nr:carboxypeptidase regulatory-like domain-containing protein [Arsenicibacter rosenii]
MYFSLYFFLSRDIEDVRVKGLVFDSTEGRPLSNVKVIIRNERYESDAGKMNYDEYLGHDQIVVYTDSKGFFSCELKKSAFLWLIFSKAGYEKYIEPGKNTNKNMQYRIVLKRK